jgi:hypothetical protein
MKEFQPHQLAVLSNLLQGLADALHVSQSYDGKAARDGRVRNKTRQNAKVAEVFEAIGEHYQICRDVGFVLSAKTVYKMAELRASRVFISDRELYRLVEELQGRLHDEMEETTFFSLSAKEASQYLRPFEGWEEIVEQFPDATSDIEEASKCLALSRHAASVFHSLQVVEFGLLRLGEFLDSEDPNPGWTSVASRLRVVVEKPFKVRNQFERDNYVFIEQVQGTVEALKNAWRNKVSHAQGKLAVMTADFSREIAEEILYASRSFMRRLAEGLPK